MTSELEGQLEEIDEDFDESECETCDGEGWVYEDDYECDWVNYGHSVIPCPSCCEDDGDNDDES